MIGIKDWNQDESKIDYIKMGEMNERNGIPDKIFEKCDNRKDD